MRLTPMGERHIERFGVPEDAARARPRGQASIEDDFKGTSRSGPTRLDISASVRSVITGQTGVQTLFVYVTDQEQRPVQGASAKAVVHYAASDQIYDFAPTGASGFTSHSFEILPSAPGHRVVIDVNVTYYDHVLDTTLTGTTQAFFIPWW
jgi:hypothetical protein